MNIEQLLQPIKGSEPQGINVREDANAQITYYDLKEHRQPLQREQEEALLDGQTTIKQTKWQSIMTRQKQLLQQAEDTVM